MHRTTQDQQPEKLLKKVIDAEIPKIVHEKIRKASVIRLQKIEEGERDFRF